MSWKNIIKKNEQAIEEYPRIMRLFLKETDPKSKQVLHEYMQMLERKMGVPESTIEQRELNRGGSMHRSKGD